MRAEIVFLGTSSTVPTVERNHTAIYMRHGQYRYLFDCGEGTQRQMTIAKLSPMKINDIFITHMHGDHVLGLPGIVQTSCMRDRKEPLRIHGPKGIKGAVKLVREFSEYALCFELEAVEVKDGVCIERDDHVISAFPVEHGMPAVGYVLQGRDDTNIDEAALRKIGLNPGPLYKRLKAGESVEWNGKKIRPEKYLAKRPGVRIVYTGDTAPAERVVKEADGADLLIHDSTFAQDIVQNARKFMHSTAKEAAISAREANVKQLVLTHFSSRYKEAELDKLLGDAKKEFDNVVVAHDFDRIEL